MSLKNFTTFECSRCGTCCSVPVVPVTDGDVRRICERTGRKASSFVRFYSPSEMDFDSESDVWIRFSYGKRALGLKRKNDACFFLNDRKLCDIYDSRPMTCRTFPYMVEFDENDLPVKASWNHIVDCKCRRKKPSPISQVINDVYKEDEEDDVYFDKVKQWNKKKSKSGTEGFLEFLGLL